MSNPMKPCPWCKALNDASNTSCHQCSNTMWGKPEAPAMSASEALYGFAGWLTTREQPVTISSTHDSAIVAELVGLFIQENGLPEPVDGWEKNLTHPSQPVISGPNPEHHTYDYTPDGGPSIMADPAAPEAPASEQKQEIINSFQAIDEARREELMRWRNPPWTNQRPEVGTWTWVKEFTDSIPEIVRIEDEEFYVYADTAWFCPIQQPGEPPN